MKEKQLTTNQGVPVSDNQNSLINARLTKDYTI
jgi:catalase